MARRKAKSRKQGCSRSERTRISPVELNDTADVGVAGAAGRSSSGPVETVEPGVAGPVPALPAAGVSGPLPVGLPGKWQHHALICLALVALTSVVYLGDLRLGFFRIDDLDYVVNNPWIRSFSGKNLWFILTQPYFFNFSPLHLLSYSVDYAVNGVDPFVFHLSSNLWAGVAAASVYLLAVALTRSIAGGALAAVLFVLHPSHVEAVAWVSSRKDLVAAAFAAPALWAYLRYREMRGKQWGWYALALILYSCALAGKQSVVILPVVFGVFDVFVERRRLRTAAIWCDKIPFVLVSAVFALRVLGAQPAESLKVAPITSCWAFTENLWLLTGLGEYVIYRLSPTLGAGPGLVCVAVVVLSLLLPLVLLWRGVPALPVVLWYWAIMAFVPTQLLGFVHPVSDRYLFYPSVPTTILTAWLLLRITQRWPVGGRAISASVFAILALATGWKTVSYVAEWGSPLSVWHQAREKSTDPYVPLYLADHIQEAALKLRRDLRGDGQPSAESTRFVRAYWQGDDARMSQIKGEWTGDEPFGPLSQVLFADVLDHAWELYEEARAGQGKRLLPVMYIHRAQNRAERGNIDQARMEYETARAKAKQIPHTETQVSVEVVCLAALARLDRSEGRLAHAFEKVKAAQELQARHGGNWVPGIQEEKKRVEQAIIRQDATRRSDALKTAKTRIDELFAEGQKLTGTEDFEEARKRFNEALAVAAGIDSEIHRAMYSAFSVNALAVVEWRAKEYGKAMELLLQVREAQQKHDRVWLPDLDGNITKLEGIIARRVKKE